MSPQSGPVSPQLRPSRRICEESRAAWQALQSPCPTEPRLLYQAPARSNGLLHISAHYFRLHLIRSTPFFPTFTEPGGTVLDWCNRR